MITWVYSTSSWLRANLPGTQNDPRSQANFPGRAPTVLSAERGGAGRRVEPGPKLFADVTDTNMCHVGLATSQLKNLKMENCDLLATSNLISRNTRVNTNAFARAPQCTPPHRLIIRTTTTHAGALYEDFALFFGGAV